MPVVEKIPAAGGLRQEACLAQQVRVEGKPAPEWMKKGVPYLAKGRDQVPAANAPVQAGSAVPERD